MILAPQPSWLWVLVDFYLITLHRPELFIIHLLISYTLLFMIFSSLLVCLVRDPGPPNAVFRSEGAAVEGEEMGLREALMPDDDFSYPHRWCRKCWVSGDTHSAIGSYFLNHYRLRSQKGRTTAQFVVDVFRKWVRRNGKYVVTYLIVYADHHCPWIGARCIVRI